MCKELRKQLGEYLAPAACSTLIVAFKILGGPESLDNEKDRIEYQKFCESILKHFHINLLYHQWENVISRELMLFINRAYKQGAIKIHTLLLIQAHYLRVLFWENLQVEENIPALSIQFIDQLVERLLLSTSGMCHTPVESMDDFTKLSVCQKLFILSEMFKGLYKEAFKDDTEGCLYTLVKNDWTTKARKQVLQLHTNIPVRDCLLPDIHDPYYGPLVTSARAFYTNVVLEVHSNYSGMPPGGNISEELEGAYHGEEAAGHVASARPGGPEQAAGGAAVSRPAVAATTPDDVIEISSDEEKEVIYVSSDDEATREPGPVSKRKRPRYS